MKRNIPKLSAVAAAALAGAACLALPAQAADVTFERLLNPEPENWLRDHGNYSNWRYSRLDQINQDNVSQLQVVFMASLGGRMGSTLPSREESAILVNDGAMFVSDGLNRVMRFDVSSGRAAVPVWRYDPAIVRSRTSRGIALYGDSVVASSNDMRITRINTESGEAVWEVDATAPPDPQYGTPSPDTQGFTAAPTVLHTKGGRDLVLQGESTGGQRGTISWVGAFDFETGELAWRFFTIPFPGQPGHETWADDHEAWRTGGAGVWQSPAFDPDLNLVYYGTGDAMPTFDPEYRPGDNLFASSTIALDVDTGKLVWYFQETPNEQWDYDTPNPRILYEQDGRPVVGNFARNGFFYTHDRTTGAFMGADQWAVKVNWTAGIDPKTGRPVDYVEGAGVQNYAGVGPRRGQTSGDTCPTFLGAPAGLQPPAFDPSRMLAFVQSAEGCEGPVKGFAPEDAAPVEIGKAPKFPDLGAAFSSPVLDSLLAINVTTGNVVARVQRQEPFGESGVLATAGNLVFAGHPHGDFVAYNPDTLAEVWSFNVGTAITAPPTTYSVGGRQYVAVVTGGSGSGLWQPAANIVVWALPN